MKPLLLDLLRDEPDDFRRRSRTREYLQARILLALQDSGAFTNWAFVGGTALRFLYSLPRYSEDLDFSLAPPDGEARFEKHMDSVRVDLLAEAYDVEIRTRAGSTVAAALVKFRGLLYELGLSPHSNEVFMIKVEMDTRPPAGALTETRLVRRFIMLNLHHYDRPSLLAGKLHAILSRKFTKGRDLYDLAWYLSDPDWPEPNLMQLNNALRQTNWEGSEATPDNWRSLIAKKLQTIDWKQALHDVSPFLERKQDAALVSESVLLPLLKKKESGR
ncbi:MAG: nucleotidyl transferase AbiEii/AbiGii toxin family protein [Verrucomicrobia bacterium]|nr:nucleotidyl transferase AbiEii/AbiGii toxin family protein [Verrucomicrobiota bacterium]MDA1068066.1 nucleotidyl transferase AbiEii/AbiGii toxin family protein [Verrucomicrobiota bacterium]